MSNAAINIYIEVFLTYLRKYLGVEFLAHVSVCFKEMTKLFPEWLYNSAFLQATDVSSTYSAFLPTYNVVRAFVLIFFSSSFSAISPGPLSKALQRHQSERVAFRRLGVLPPWVRKSWEGSVASECRHSVEFWFGSKIISFFILLFHSISHFLRSPRLKLSGTEGPLHSTSVPVRVLFSPCRLVPWDVAFQSVQLTFFFFFSCKAGTLGQIACFMILNINPLLTEFVLSNRTVNTSSQFLQWLASALCKPWLLCPWAFNRGAWPEVLRDKCVWDLDLLFSRESVFKFCLALQPVGAFASLMPQLLQSSAVQLVTNLNGIG